MTDENPGGLIPGRDLMHADAALNAALAAAQGEFPPIPRERKVTVKGVTKDGKRYEYDYAYAPLDVILKLVRPILAAHGLALVQRMENPNGQPALRTELRHADGGVLAASFPLGNLPTNPQQLGSLLTYLRRYALCAILCVAAEEDDDGQQAAARPRSDTTPDVAPSAPDLAAGEESPFHAPDQLHADEGGAADLSEKQRRMIYGVRARLIKAGLTSEADVALFMSTKYGTEKISELTAAQASDLIDRLVSKEKEGAATNPK